jgi:hypothetical protein
MDALVLRKFLHIAAMFAAMLMFVGQGMLEGGRVLPRAFLRDNCPQSARCAVVTGEG